MLFTQTHAAKVQVASRSLFTLLLRVSWACKLAAILDIDMHMYDRNLRGPEKRCIRTKYIRERYVHIHRENHMTAMQVHLLNGIKLLLEVFSAIHICKDLIHHVL